MNEIIDRLKKLIQIYEREGLSPEFEKEFQDLIDEVYSTSPFDFLEDISDEEESDYDAYPPLPAPDEPSGPGGGRP